MSDTENKGFDLHAVGALPSEPTNDQDQQEGDPLQTILDSLMVSLHQRDVAIAKLEARTASLERFVSYLLSRDEKFAATMQQKAQPNEKAE